MYRVSYDSCNRTFYNDTTTPSGPGLIIGEASRLHTPSFSLSVLVGLLWTSEQTVAETLTTHTHAPGGIRTCNSNKRAAAEPRLRAHDQWDRPLFARYEW